MKGQIYAYTDNLDLKVLGVGMEWMLGGIGAVAGGAAGFLLSPTIVINPIAATAVGFAAGAYAGNLIGSVKENRTFGDYMKQMGIGILGGAGGAGLTYAAIVFAGPASPLVMAGLLTAEGALIGHAAGRVVSSAAVNPENTSFLKRLAAGLYLTENKLHTLVAKNNSKDYGFCITS
jgi:hypothetical protein